MVTVKSSTAAAAAGIAGQFLSVSARFRVSADRHVSCVATLLCVLASGLDSIDIVLREFSLSAYSACTCRASSSPLLFEYFRCRTNAITAKRMITAIAMPTDLPAEVLLLLPAAWFIAFATDELNAVGSGVAPVVGGGGPPSSDAADVVFSGFTSLATNSFCVVVAAVMTATVVTAGIGAVVLEVMVLATEARVVAVVAMVLMVVMVAMVVVVMEVVVVVVVVVEVVVVVVVVVVEVVVVTVVVVDRVVVVMVVVGMEQMAVGIGLPACLHEVRQPVLKVPCRLHQCVASTQVHVGPLAVPDTLVAPFQRGRCRFTFPAQFEAQNIAQSQEPLSPWDSTVSAASQSPPAGDGQERNKKRGNAVAFPLL